MKLHSVSEVTAWVLHLRMQSIHMSHNDHLKVRLNTAIAQNDSHSIDVKYHKKCWTENVLNAPKTVKEKVRPSEAQLTATVELLHIIDIETSQKQKLSIEVGV